MNGIEHNELILDILEPTANRGYLPRPIPTERDSEITKLLSQIIHNNEVARFAHNLKEGHRVVLRVFAERMASSAVREKDPSLLRLGLIAILLSWGASESREALTIMPLFYDAVGRLGLNLDSFAAEIRETIGDKVISPLAEYLRRAEKDKSLQSMGYSAGVDSDGFRYLRNW